MDEVTLRLGRHNVGGTIKETWEGKVDKQSAVVRTDAKIERFGPMAEEVRKQMGGSKDVINSLISTGIRGSLSFQAVAEAVYIS